MAEIDITLKNKLKKVDICIALNTICDVIDEDIKANLNAEELGGPFDDEWEREMKFKTEMRNELNKTAEICGAKRIGPYYERKVRKKYE